MLALALLAVACVGDDAPLVVTEEVRPGEVVQTISAPATVEPAARQAVAATVPGTIVAIEAADGSQVQGGQVIVRLSSAEVEAAQEEAAAARQATAEVDADGFAVEDGGQRMLQTTHEAVAALDASTKPVIADARAKAEQLPHDPHRAIALAAVEAAEHAYQGTRAALLASGQQIAGQQEAFAASLAVALRQALAQATAPLTAQAASADALAQAQAAQLVLAAPFTATLQLGQIGTDGGSAPLLPDVPAELSGLAGGLGQASGAQDTGVLRVGATVSPGQTVFTVYDLSTLYASAEVDEVDAPQVQVGQRATVLVDAVPDGSFLGIVERIALEATTTEAGGTGYPVRIRIVGPSKADPGEEPADLEALRVGMTGSAEVETKTAQSDLVVPSRALLRRGEDTIVYAVRENLARAIPVEVAALGENDAAVLGDLRPDDEVVVEGYEDLSDGTRVRIR